MFHSPLFTATHWVASDAGNRYLIAHDHTCIVSLFPPCFNWETITNIIFFLDVFFLKLEIGNGCASNLAQMRAMIIRTKARHV